jgi:hypothetical protein
VKRKPRLDEFENIFSASLLDEGLELSHIKKNWKIIEDKSSLSGTYTEVGFPAIHVKINKTNQYILNFTCDCLLFNEAKGCKHVTGLFYYLKNKSIRLVPVNENRKVGFDSVLEVTQFHELASFIRFYASNNTGFNKIFKQYFNYKFIGHGKTFDDYLNELIISYLNVSGKLDAKANRQLYQIFEMHLVRAESLIQQGDFNNGVEILKSILTRFYQFDFELNVKSTKHLITKAHEMLYLVVNQEVAPGLKRKLYKFSINLVNSIHYQYFTNPNAVQIATHIAESNTLDMKLALENKINDVTPELKSEWVFQLFLYDHAIGDFNFIQFYTNYLDDDQCLIGFLAIIKNENTNNLNLDRIIEAVILKGNISNRSISIGLADYLIQTAKVDLYVLLFKKMVQLSIDLNALNSFINLNVALENPEIATLISESEEIAKIKVNNPNEYLRIVSKAMNATKVFQFGEEFPFFEEMPVILPLLLDDDSDRATSLLINSTKYFLDLHLGSHYNSVIEEIISVLNKQHQDEVLKIFKRFILENYGGRKHLVKILKT